MLPGGVVEFDLWVRVVEVAWGPVSITAGVGVEF